MPLERDALERLRERLAALAPEGIGITLDGFTLHDLHPPPEVVNSYHAVAKAIQERDRMINEAEADASRQKRRAQEEADRVLKRADADTHAAREAAAHHATKEQKMAREWPFPALALQLAGLSSSLRCRAPGVCQSRRA